MRPHISISRARPRIGDIDSRPLEIPDVARHKGRAAAAGYGRDPAIGLVDRPTRAAPAGRDLGVGSGGGAVERQDPVGETEIEPTGHGGLQRLLPPAGRQDRDAVEQFRFADRRQKQLLRVARRDPCRDGRRRRRLHELGRHIRIDYEHSVRLRRSPEARASGRGAGYRARRRRAARSTRG